MDRPNVLVYPCEIVFINDKEQAWITLDGMLDIIQDNIKGVVELKELRNNKVQIYFDLRKKEEINE